MHIEVPHPLLNNRKAISLGQYISKFSIPLPNNKKTHCVGQYISKFPTPYPTIEKHNGTGLGTWICIDPNI
jgi:hypothetical protein